jgi:hypothetical protein
MRKVRDMLTPDMFEMPQPVSHNPGSLSCRAEISGVMSEVIKDCELDRYQIAADMSRLLGREVTKYMLDAYTSESRNTQMPPIDTAIAFDIATNGVSLLKLHADKLGCRVVVGREVLYTELGRIEQAKKDLAVAEKAIKKHLEKT